MRQREPQRSVRLHTLHTHKPIPCQQTQAEGGSRALSEGSVLVMEDRTPIGCIEEIFGPGAGAVCAHTVRWFGGQGVVPC